jgi:Ras family
MDVPVILVANKTDQFDDRMVTTEEGYKRSQEIGCACFHEISIRESIDEVFGVFRDICRFWRFISRFPKLKRSKSDSIRLSMTLHSDIDPEKIISICCDLQDEQKRSILFGRSRSTWPEGEENDDEFDELDSTLNINEPFRSRAKTDGNLLISRSRKWKLPSHLISSPPVMQSLPMYKTNSRRNSISMRGHVSC